MRIVDLQARVEDPITVQRSASPTDCGVQACLLSSGNSPRFSGRQRISISSASRANEPISTTAIDAAASMFGLSPVQLAVGELCIYRQLAEYQEALYWRYNDIAPAEEQQAKQMSPAEAANSDRARDDLR